MVAVVTAQIIARGWRRSCHAIGSMSGATIGLTPQAREKAAPAMATRIIRDQIHLEWHAFCSRKVSVSLFKRTMQSKSHIMPITSWWPDEPISRMGIGCHA